MVIGLGADQTTASWTGALVADGDSYTLVYSALKSAPFHMSFNLIPL
ncbi:MAG: hypothetical protein HQK52_21115 [Oligoflexia bacterium]|nr:hypothetical protein [Oligoflexia bacterium]